MELDKKDAMFFASVTLIAILMIYMLFRNSWIHDLRNEAIEQNVTSYRQMISYDDMLYNVFLWDKEKIKNIRK